MKSLANKLERIGLPEKEAVVYLVALEAAFGISIATIARKTGIKRSTVYLALGALKNRGLMSTTRSGNRHLYIAEDPHVLEEKIKEQGSYLRELLPELLSVTNVLARKPQIRFFEGVEGIKDVYRDTLVYPGGEIIAWATGDILDDFSTTWLTNTYVPARIEKKIHSRVLAPDTAELRKLAGDNISALRTLRLLSSDQAPFSIEVNLYGKRKMALISFKEQFGIIIESVEIFKTFQAIFENAWHITTKGKSDFLQQNPAE